MLKIDTKPWSVKAVKHGEHNHGAFFSCNVYRGSRKAGSASDDGWGGPINLYGFSDEDMGELVTFANKFYDSEYTENAGMLISELVNQYVYRAMVQRKRKTATVFTVYEDGDTDGYGAAYMINIPYGPKVIDAIYSSNKGTIVIANEEFGIYPDGATKVER